MAITGQNIVDRARIKAKDAATTKRWSDAESLYWLNDGQREVVQVLPRANTKRVLATVASGTRQTLTGLGITDGIQFMDVVRNYDTTGVTPGSAIVKCKRSDLDGKYRNWHSRLAAEADHWMSDEDDPTAIYIWPAVSGSGKLEVIYSALPTDLASLASTISLNDVYANALQWFLLFSWHSKDAEHEKSALRASSYYQLFLQSLGVRDKRVSETQAKSNAKQAGAM